MNTHKRPQVLYVEDNTDSFEMLQVMLAAERIDLQSAGSIAEGLAKAGAQRFDLYLLDSGLPDGNGFSLCRILRAIDPDVPVLFYSGNAYPAEIKVAMAAGAHGYITKPHSEKLAETILHLVATHREEPVAKAFLPVFISAAA